MQNVAVAVAPLVPNFTERAQPSVPENIGGPSSTESLAAIAPEIITAIEIAASAFVGKKVRVVSVQIPPQPASSAWAEHRLTLIHGMHNLVQRRH